MTIESIRVLVFKKKKNGGGGGGNLPAHNLPSVQLYVALDCVIFTVSLCCVSSADRQSEWLAGISQLI